MMNETIYVAGTRFGMGLRPVDVRRIGNSPQSWLSEQIRSPQVISPAFSTLPSSAKNMQYVLESGRDIKESNSDNKKDAQKMLRENLKDVFIDEMRAKIYMAATTETPFYERLVDFWSNHFAVSTKKGKVAGLVGAFEREAIRPHVTGKFIDMVLAVTHHPAMLIYLDNAQSIGPDSVAGQRRDKGLNENLAREIMELHTLGVDGGYTQKDVTSFAKVITGWSVGVLDSDNPGAFDFAPRRHEPGTQYIMGRGYADDGEAQGIAVLRDLAANPATANHIATKLARHFIADDPPQDAVSQLAEVFLNTGGDLSRIYDTLITIRAAWNSVAHPKIKNSYDLVISALRVSDQSDERYIDYALKSLKFLGDMPFSANSPAGLPDKAQDIAGPEAMIRRVEWAQMAAIKLEPRGSIGDLIALAMGPTLSDATRSAIAGARRNQEAVAIVFGSPEFQKR